MSDYFCMVPRNLSKPDSISIGKFELTWRQIGYIAIGGAITYYAFTTGWPIIAKITISTVGFLTSLSFSFIKIKGSELDDLTLNSIIYAQRKMYYKKLEKEGVMSVTIKSKEEETTVKTRVQKISIQSA